MSFVSSVFDQPCFNRLATHFDISMFGHQTMFDGHFNLPNHSMQHLAVCGVSLHQGNTESRKTLEQKFIFQIGTLNPNGINERFSFN